MTDKEKKKYIIDNIKRSSGGKITEMLKRYWNVRNNTQTPKKTIEETAKEIFS